mmetsp:Transcript_36787/g.97646  ORF Transcript_36787/g.97646 Transcript_36787/m.97646 type:complete len:2566 (+) Transcript_36787:73-7770(+)
MHPASELAPYAQQECPKIPVSEINMQQVQANGSAWESVRLEGGVGLVDMLLLPAGTSWSAGDKTMVNSISLAACDHHPLLENADSDNAAARNERLQSFLLIGHQTMFKAVHFLGYSGQNSSLGNLQSNVLAPVNVGPCSWLQIILSVGDDNVQLVFSRKDQWPELALNLTKPTIEIRTLTQAGGLTELQLHEVMNDAMNVESALEELIESINFVANADTPYSRLLLLYADIDILLRTFEASIPGAELVLSGLGRSSYPAGYSEIPYYPLARVQDLGLASYPAVFSDNPNYPRVQGSKSGYSSPGQDRGTIQVPAWFSSFNSNDWGRGPHQYRGAPSISVLPAQSGGGSAYPDFLEKMWYQCTDLEFLERVPATEQLSPEMINQLRQDEWMMHSTLELFQGLTDPESAEDIRLGTAPQAPAAPRLKCSESKRKNMEIDTLREQQVIHLCQNGLKLCNLRLLVDSLPRSLTFATLFLNLEAVCLQGITGIKNIELGIFLHQKLNSFECTACADLQSVTVQCNIEDLQSIGMLKKLDFSNNHCLRKLPLNEICQITSVDSLFCNNCWNLWSPPREVTSRGGKDTMLFVRQINKDAVPNTVMSLFLLGDGESGKTSLFRALKSQNNRADPIREDHRTIGITKEDWLVQDSQTDILFRVMDLAGQAVYENINQFFLYRRAIFLLVWRAYSVQDDHLGQLTERIRHWLEVLQMRLPDARVILVVTHVDSVSSGVLDSQCDEVQETVTRSLSSFKQWSIKDSPIIEVLEGGKSFRVNCLLGDGIQELRNKLVNFTSSTPWFKEILPRSWIELQSKVIQAVQDGRKCLSPAEWNRLAEMVGMSPDGYMFKVATEFLNDIGVIRFAGVIRNPSAGGYTGLPKESRSYSGTVFIDTAYMVDVLKGLIMHDRQALLDFFKGTGNIQKLRMVNRLNACGMLDCSLLPFIWPATESSFDYWDATRQKNVKERELWSSDIVKTEYDIENAVELLEGFDIVVQQGKEYLVPSLIPLARSANQLQFDPDRFPFQSTTIYPTLPLSVFQRAAVRIGRWASSVEFMNNCARCHWKAHVAYMTYNAEDCQSEVHLRIISSGQQLLAKIKNEISTVEMFFPGLGALKGTVTNEVMGTEIYQVCFLQDLKSFDLAGHLDNEKGSMFMFRWNCLHISLLFQGYLSKESIDAKWKRIADKMSEDDKSLVDVDFLERFTPRIVIMVVSEQTFKSRNVLDALKVLKNSTKPVTLIPLLTPGASSDLEIPLRDFFQDDLVFDFQPAITIEHLNARTKVYALKLKRLIEGWRDRSQELFSFQEAKIQCHKCTRPSFSRVNLLLSESSEITCIHCGGLQLVEELLLVPVNRQCPVCVKSNTKMPGTFDTTKIKYTYKLSQMVQAPVLECSRCKADGRTGQIHFFNILPPDIFVLVAQGSDEELVTCLLSEIEMASDLVVWMGRAGSKIHQEESLAAMRLCAFVIVILSDESLHSHHFQKNLKNILDSGKIVLPVLTPVWLGPSDDTYWRPIEAALGADQTWTRLKSIAPMVWKAEADCKDIANRISGSFFSCVHRSLKLKAYSSMPMMGLRLSSFDALIESWGGGKVLCGMSTHQVMTVYVMRQTQNSRMCLCDHLVSDSACSRFEVATAEWFVSHAWALKFLDVVDALKRYFKTAKDDDPFLWFDVFSVNQHSTEERDYDWWNTAFLQAVGQIGSVVMVLQPWDKPETLSRAWCIFELFACNSTQSRFSVAMTQTDADTCVQQLLEEDGLERVLAVFKHIHCDQAQASMASDRDCIFDMIQRTVGFSKLDHLVIDMILDCFTKELKQRMEGHALSSDHLFKVAHTLAKLYWLQHDVEHTVFYCCECLKLGGKLPNEDKLLPVLVLLGEVGSITQRNDLADIIVDFHGLAKQIESQPDHQYFFDSLYILGLHVSQCNDVPELSKYLACFEEKMSQMQTVHPFTIYQYGVLLEARKDVERALVEYRKFCLEVESKFGINHVHCLDVKMRIYHLLDVSHGEEKQNLLLSVLSGRERILGFQHADTSAVRDAIVLLQSSNHCSPAEIQMEDTMTVSNPKLLPDQLLNWSTSNLRLNVMFEQLECSNFNSSELRKYVVEFQGMLSDVASGIRINSDSEDAVQQVQNFFLGRLMCDLIYALPPSSEDLLFSCSFLDATVCSMLVPGFDSLYLLHSLEWSCNYLDTESTLLLVSRLKQMKLLQTLDLSWMDLSSDTSAAFQQVFNELQSTLLSGSLGFCGSNLSFDYVESLSSLASAVKNITIMLSHNHPLDQLDQVSVKECEQLGVQMCCSTLATSNFKKMAGCSKPRDEIDMMFGLKHYLLLLAESLGVAEDDVVEFLKQLRRESLASWESGHSDYLVEEMFSNPENYLQRLWTLNTKLKLGPNVEKGLDFLINEGIKRDDADLLKFLMPLVHSLNYLISGPGKELDAPWPETGYLFRGWILPEKHKGFFCPGRKYRTPAFISASSDPVVAVKFAIRSFKESKDGNAPVLWIFKLDSVAVTKPQQVGGELKLQTDSVLCLKHSRFGHKKEYLFPPYSVFAVTRTVWSNDLETCPHVIMVKATTHIFESEELPAAPCY